MTSLIRSASIAEQCMAVTDYNPCQIILTNQTRYHLDFLMRFPLIEEVYSFRLEPLVSKEMAEIAAVFRDSLRSERCIVTLIHPSESLFFNFEVPPTKECIQIQLEETEKHAFVLPKNFQTGVNLKWILPPGRALYRRSIPLINHYEARYGRFLKKLESSSRLLLNTATLIPEQLHFVWLGSSLLEEDFPNLSSFRDYHPDWEIVLWSEEDRLSIKALDFCEKNRIKIESVHRAFERLDLETTARLKMLFYHFLKTRQYGMASDLIRMIILYQQGGIYSDCDNKCFKKFDSLVRLHTFFSGLCPIHKGIVKINNDIIGASAEHPIVLGYLNQILDNFSQNIHAYTLEELKDRSEIESGSRLVQNEQLIRTIHTTGPMCISRAYRRYIDSYDDEMVLIYPSDSFHPEGGCSAAFDKLDHPVIWSYSAALFRASWITAPKEILKRVSEEKEEIIDLSYQTLFQYMTSKKKEDPASLQLHFFHLNIYKHLDEIIDWIVEEFSEPLHQIKVWNFLFTDISFPTLEKLILKSAPDSLMIVPKSLDIRELKDSPQIRQFEDI